MKDRKIHIVKISNYVLRRCLARPWGVSVDSRFAGFTRGPVFSAVIYIALNRDTKTMSTEISSRRSWKEIFQIFKIKVSVSPHEIRAAKSRRLCANYSRRRHTSMR